MIHPAYRDHRRRGFSLTVVLLFLLLLMYLWSVVYKTTGCLVRVQTARVQRDLEDAGMRNALAKVLMFIENDVNKETPTLKHAEGPYQFTVKVVNDQVARWPVDNVTTFTEAIGQSARYSATITADTAGPKRWTVDIAPYDPGNVAPELPSE